MSEIRLNLIDSQQILTDTIHGSIGDACVAALSAEPETIAELACALARFQKPLDHRNPFASFHSTQTIDERPYDAGILIIDLASRTVACESTYSQPGHEGCVDYHNGVCATDIVIHYQIPDDWIFLSSVEEYEGLRDERQERRTATPPLDARAILYGRPLLEFIVNAVAQTSVCIDPQSDTRGQSNVLHQSISTIHARWLMTPRDDLRGQSPRDVMLLRQKFIDYDLNSRETQWGLLGEGPPSIPTDSFAYRFAGFGTHEWVVYYDLVRHLLWSVMLGQHLVTSTEQEEHEGQPKADLTYEWPRETEAQIELLEQLKTDWLEHPQPEFDGGIPAHYIDKERKRLPLVMSGRDVMIDENCPTCQALAAETALGLGFCFSHLDGCNMDEGFAFSNFLTHEEWEADRRRWEEFHKQYDREHEKPDVSSLPDERQDPF